MLGNLLSVLVIHLWQLSEYSEHSSRW